MSMPMQSTMTARAVRSKAFRSARTTTLSCPSHNFSTSSSRFSIPSSSAAYAKTINNLKLTSSTRVLYQGFTGRVSTSNARESIAYGTNIVGGTTPGKSGEHLGLPLYPSVREAAEKLKPDATAVFVGANHAASAIEDAIEAEIGLIVAVAEFLPVHDLLRIFQVLNTQSKSRLVGANSPGIIAPLHHCRIGFQPLPCYMPGHIGMIAKSGTLSYETVGALTRAGLGQSLCIGMGGDIVAGTNMVEALELFEHDDDTEGIILAGEVGGRAELDAAEWIKEYKQRSSNPKPIAAVIGGKTAKPGRIMGHAGAFASLGEEPAAFKAKALADAGVEVVQHPTEFATVMPRLLKQAGRNVDKIRSSAASAANQKRGYHTTRTFTRPRWSTSIDNQVISHQQKRNLHFDDKLSKQMLEQYDIKTSTDAPEQKDSQYLAITVDRTGRTPAIMASPTTNPSQVFKRSKTFPYDYSAGPDQSTVQAVIRHLQLDAAPPSAMANTGKLVTTLARIFKDKEAYALETHVSGTQDGSLAVSHAAFSFDDSALKSAKRQQDVHSQRDLSKADPDELAVEKDGIVYIKLDNPDAYVATLINGAGLAMNALDVLTDQGAYPTNFLDTGGKATSETIKKSFEVILRDPRVKVIFVNIFGGLTDCKMIAEGIALAFKELKMDIPVVTRLRGTNEEAGQKMIAESGLPLHAFDDFFEAAEKCKELAGRKA